MRGFKVPSPATCMSALALFVAVSTGAAVAASLPKDSVGSPQIKTNAVKTQELAPGAVTGKEIQNGSVGSADVKDGSLGAADIKDGAVEPKHLSNPPSLGLTRDSNQAVPTFTSINWNAELWDVGVFHYCCDVPHSPGTEHIDIHEHGIYQFDVNVEWNAAPDDVTGFRSISLLRVTGPVEDATLAFSALSVDTLNADLNPTTQSLSVQAPLLNGDRVVLNAAQQTKFENGTTTGSSIVQNSSSPRLTMTWISPLP